VVNEIVNNSDSDTGNIPEFSSSEESESESVNESDNESNISIPGPSCRQIDVTPTTGFSENDRQPRIPPFIGNPENSRSLFVGTRKYYSFHTKIRSS